MDRKKTITDTRMGEQPGNHMRFDVEETAGDATTAAEYNVLRDGERYQGSFACRQDAVESAEDDSGDVRY